MRIGIDRPAAAATGSPDEWAGSRPLRNYSVADFAALAAVRHHRPVIVLDVRRLPARLGELPPNRTVITVCRSGHRSARAAAPLARDGRDVINLAGGRHAWARAGLPVVASGGRPGYVG